MELQVGVKAFIKNDKDEYLILKRAQPYPGGTELKWDIPGGGINPGKPVFQALAREIKEETGMEMVGGPKIIFVQDILRVEGKHVVRLTFEAQAAGDVNIDPKEHSEFRWSSLDNFKKLIHDIYLDPVFETMGGWLSWLPACR